ncbi:tRNA glutamyl-Q(34) synthetase GluQRS [Allohahella marinimesophila]|uniref:tRNA glutamyl-Q(34) synthetase GluQRS n=1 Tax=Allohahella marinimesophila TaxID=1054972 RepID=A0ABP7P7S8_9GAMM
MIAAVASFLDAKARGGDWQVRIEDIDPLRSRQLHITSILNSLESHGLTWDGPIVYQSARITRYKAICNDLQSLGAVFACVCSRKDIRLASCLPCSRCDQPCRQSADVSWRFRVANREIHFTDRIQGFQSASLMPIVEEPVLLRRDGVFAYQLAVVVDDHDTGITDVVRGTDLLSETFAQQALYQVLQWAPPSFAHFPIIVDEQGQKLSKQSKAPPLDDRRVMQNLLFCMKFLGMGALADSSIGDDPGSLLRQAIAAWQPGALQGVRQLMAKPPTS